MTDRKAGPKARLFAWAFARMMGPYEVHIRQCKANLFNTLSAGTILEIGPGTGSNLAFLPPEARYLGAEPNPFMHPYLRETARRLGRDVQILRATAEATGLPDRSVDAVISTLVLCSVPDPAKALAEVRRVLAPTGRLLFIEHVAAPRGTWSRRLQSAVRPIWSALGDGCRPDRPTDRAIAEAGFSRIEFDAFRVPFPVISPHIAGTAWR